MTPAFHPDELGLGTPPGERAELKVVAHRLEVERPLPSPAFRGDLQRLLLRSRDFGLRPARLRLQIALYGCSGILLLLVGASSAAGVGPLSA
jgi:hypothetical protein